MSRSQPTISLAVHSAPDPAARSAIIQGLDDYNSRHAGSWDSVALDVYAVDPADHRVIGGLVGRTSLGVFFIDYFYLPERLRGRGHGAAILTAAEDEAVARGCSVAVLFTMAIQAPAFYQKRGYRTFGTIACHPPGNARIFMTRQLAMRSMLTPR
jgi:GNAT superfamily N-acetyltransferase